MLHLLTKWSTIDPNIEIKNYKIIFVPVLQFYNVLNYKFSITKCTCYKKVQEVECKEHLSLASVCMTNKKEKADKIFATNKHKLLRLLLFWIEFVVWYKTNICSLGTCSSTNVDKRIGLKSV